MLRWLGSNLKTNVFVLPKIPYSVALVRRTLHTTLKGIPPRSSFIWRLGLIIFSIVHLNIIYSSDVDRYAYSCWRWLKAAIKLFVDFPANNRVFSLRCEICQNYYSTSRNGWIQYSVITNKNKPSPAVPIQPVGPMKAWTNRTRTWWIVFV